jgi:hypothetical protein
MQNFISGDALLKKIGSRWEKKIRMSQQKQTCLYCHKASRHEKVYALCPWPHTAIFRQRTRLAAISTRNKHTDARNILRECGEWERRREARTGYSPVPAHILKPEGRRVTSETCHRITWLQTEWALITPYALNTAHYSSSFCCSPQKPRSSHKGSHKGSSNQTCVDRQWFTIQFVRPNWAPEQDYCTLSTVKIWPHICTKKCMKILDRTHEHEQSDSDTNVRQRRAISTQIEHNIAVCN